ncbi:PKD domain-containing protein [Flavihumibacter rivuli]|uniref:PKD domain-containing protein n=1 Tax=Flavihumibacter rivuli TaxID=2838156 RepID=UPI001BDF0190|nr:PKD domain-containing protein [Flavihumibacter rivuli]ULQ56771.1 PKD domain-containing protein [Flavihumibacter rivuli]
MKTLGIFLLALLTFCLPASAAHIRGGELSYKYLGPGSTASSSRYQITLKLYIDCRANSPGQLDEFVNFTVYNKANNQIAVPAINANRTIDEFINYDPNSNPCITNPPTDICYRLRYYSTTIELPNSTAGYLVSFQRCCRIAGIQNMSGNSGNVGATYSCDIPGTNVLAEAYKNSSPSFIASDAVAVCAGSPFTFDFSARDTEDGDSLSYSLCNAYLGGGTEAGTCFDCTSPSPTSPPPYTSVGYTAGFNGGQPLGSRASIDSKTGLISGIAPNGVGQYVVTACVNEYRQGKLINVHRKDIHISVSNCQPLKALLDPNYSFCDDFLVTLQNGQVNPSGSQYIWQYGDGSKADTTTVALGTVQHQYADTGTYKVSLKVILAGGQCQDSTTTLIKVYPGFFPGFEVIGSCLLTPFTFRDTTRSRYGVASKWTWDFGDETTNTDISIQRNPTWKFNSLGIKQARLIVESSFGCRDTVFRDFEVRDKPNLNLAFKDTLICSIDTLQLNASAPGTLNPIFSWSPNLNILNRNTPNPLVYPKTTTRYVVQLDDNGCANSDSVLVRVVDRVTLRASADTTICLTDEIQLNAAGDGLRYQWTPAATLDNPNTRNPLARPTATTTYTVEASIGKCTARDNVVVTTIPYPFANAGPDITICYDDTTQLNATIIGSSFSWTPSSTLINPETLTPLARPRRTTQYVLSVLDNLGCPKPGRDTVLVTVRQPIRAFAGNDTSVVIGQPLQLNGSGAELFLWTPSTGLNFNNIANPVANLTQNQTYIMTAFTPEGCLGVDTINIKVFRTNPDIFVPNAFTPGKSTNTVFRPIPVGISQLEYFRVYNRWGQLVFSSSEATKGWDGKVGGQDQATGTYVWMVQGKDFTGKTIFKKGTVVLIR